MSSCHKAYFPSMLCEDVNEEVNDIKIVIHGNTFNRFYQFPNPEFVYKNELDLMYYKKTHEKALCSVGEEDDKKD